MRPGRKMRIETKTILYLIAKCSMSDVTNIINVDKGAWVCHWQSVVEGGSEGRGGRG